MNHPASSALIVSGLLAAPFFLILILALGTLEPGFSQLSQPMSMLGGVTGIRGLFFNVGVVVIGAFVVIFSFGLWRQLPKRPSARLAFSLLTIGGLGLIGAGIFHCNEGCRNILLEPNFVGRFHIFVSFLAGFGAGMALFFFWAAMRKSDSWRSFAAPTLLAAFLANVPGIIFWLAFVTGNQLDSIDGLIQRMGLVVTLIWMEYMAIRLWKAERLAPGQVPSKYS